MSVIKTWKCDGCGAISRDEKPDWYRLEIWAMRAPRRGFLESQQSVRRHVCSPECIATLVESSRTEIEALEVEA